MADKVSKQLHETQQSLAAALAHAEVQRLRLKKLELENVSLRNVLRRHGLNPGEEEEGEPVLEFRQEEAACDTAVSVPAMPTEARTPDAGEGVQSHDVILHTSNAKIPGKVVVKDERIEFMAIAAEIEPAAFVGMKFLGTFFEGQASVGLARRSVGRSTWWDSFFGPNKTGNSSPDGTPVPSPPAAASSWTSKPKGRTKKQRESSATEGISSISQLTGYFRGDTNRSGESSSSLSRDPSVPDRSVFRSDSAEGLSAGSGPGELPGPWQIIWRDSGGRDTLQTLTFEASVDTRTSVQSTIDRWNEDHRRGDSGAGAAAPAAERKVVLAGGSRVRDPEHLALGHGFTPSAAAQSGILSPEEVASLASALPGRRKLSQWHLLYSSEADGFSLQTLYRTGAHASRSMLVVQDFSGYVFGAYCTEALRVKPRYQGNGECFVFQVRPHRLKYDWHRVPDTESRNDFFMMVSQDSIGIGGAPHFAFWLDSDLLYGNSGICHTFSSPCLSGTEDFKVKAVELWQVGN